MLRARTLSHIDLVVIHCSATPNGQFVFAHEIDDWHRERGFARDERFRARQNPQLGAIGYHFVVYTNGAVSTGRHLEEVGAHVRGHNSNSIGICLIVTDAYSLPQWNMLRENVSGLQRRLRGVRIVGHRDLSPDLNGDGVIDREEWLKTCPGFDVAAWLRGGMEPLDGHICDDYDHVRSSKGAPR